ncbi:MAG: PilN domain-containing protein [Pseudomonadota bacterium]
MARINLLPWREERRKQRNNEFYVILGLAFVLGIAIWFGTRTFIGGLSDHQDEANQILRNEIAILDRRIREIEELESKRDRLLARKEVIEDLQKNRSQIVHLFDQIARTVPDGVRLETVTQRGNQLTVEGLAESNAKVSDYMRRLDASAWMRLPQLTVTEEADAEPSERYRFSVSVTIGREDRVDEDEDGGVGQ